LVSEQLAILRDNAPRFSQESVPLKGGWPLAQVNRRWAIRSQEKAIPSGPLKSSNRKHNPAEQQQMSLVWWHQTESSTGRGTARLLHSGGHAPTGTLSRS
jgi:hypothetical protein